MAHLGSRKAQVCWGAARGGQAGLKEAPQDLVRREHSVPGLAIEVVVQGLCLVLPVVRRRVLSKGSTGA